MVNIDLDFFSSSVPYVTSFSGLFIFDYPFGILQRLFASKLAQSTVQMFSC